MEEDRERLDGIGVQIAEHRAREAIEADLLTDIEDVQRDMEGRRTEDLVSILRNRDEGEWRPEVFEIVAAVLRSRGMSPEEVTAMGPEPVDTVEHQPLETIRRFFTVAEAHGCRLALESAGIASWVIDESLGAFYGVGVGARVQVRPADRVEAEALLASGPVSAAAFPTDLAEPECPSCGSPDTSQRADGDTAGERVWQFACTKCGHTWGAGAT